MDLNPLLSETAGVAGPCCSLDNRGDSTPDNIHHRLSRDFDPSLKIEVTATPEPNYPGGTFSKAKESYSLHYFFIVALDFFFVMFDCSSYSKYLFKYVILYIVFELYLVIKQITTKYIINFKF
jgi:hypothetical protein